MGGLNELRNVTFVDFPACHWSMWTHPREVGAIIAGFAGDVG